MAYTPARGKDFFFKKVELDWKREKNI